METKGAYADARARFARALAIHEKARKPGHPAIASCLMSLGIVESHMGNPNAAVALYRRALAAQEQTIGPDHPEVAISLNNLGGALVDLN